MYCLHEDRQSEKPALIARVQTNLRGCPERSFDLYGTSARGLSVEEGTHVIAYFR